ncbi:MAG: ABC transporter ATP-binding protein [Actinobacteria bacterium]|nr:MAG: ABC transporter ATP-binding protein [Actinomycetota bacterium]
MQSDPFAESGAPDSVPDDLVAHYGADARKTIRHNLSRRSRLAKRARRARQTVQGADSELWQTTALLFFLAVVGVCGIGGLVYAVYLWPRVGVSLIAGVGVLFTFSFFMARRITRRRAEASETEISLF